jgi:flagellar assembly factor FliW
MGVPTADAPATTPGSDSVADGLGDFAAAQKGLSVRHDVPELQFVRPLPGFPELARYVLVRLGDPRHEPADGAAGADPADGEAEDTVLYELRSIEQPEVRFLVGVPTAFFPDYSFDLDEVSCSELGLHTAEDALVLVILTIGDNSASTTANLLAPVVINARTRSAAQVILSGTDWPVRASVV